MNNLQNLGQGVQVNIASKKKPELKSRKNKSALASKPLEKQNKSQT